MAATPTQAPNATTPAETPEQRLDRLYAAYSAAQEAEAQARRDLDNARQAVLHATERLADAADATSAAAREWHRANGRQQRLARKGGRTA